MYRVERGTVDWPSQLDALGSDSPGGLWCRGEPDLRQLALRSVAIVGCRQASAYGRTVAADLAGELAQAGWVVISGGAFGVDAAAHRGALAVGGRTACLLASGVDVPSPRSHESLFDSIRRSGLLVSEAPHGATARPHLFLARNRLIAALSRGVVVVEADRRSGSLNTARWAAELGRVVMAVPGSVRAAQSRGTNELVRSRRAEAVGSAADILDLLEPVGSTRPEDPAGDPDAGPEQCRDLDRDVRVLACVSHAPRRVDDVAHEAGLSLADTVAALNTLATRRECEMTVDGWRLPDRLVPGARRNGTAH